LFGLFVDLTESTFIEVGYWRQAFYSRYFLVMLIERGNNLPFPRHGAESPAKQENPRCVGWGEAQQALATVT
jgi:hypothetical protein